MNDLYDLNRFVEAQNTNYDQAFSEIRAGRKCSHWMWYIFPQVKGLGFSSMSAKYAIQSLDEAGAYLQHPLLGSRLVECCEVLISIHGRSAYDIFGDPDDMKLRSSTTLFACASPKGSVFHRVIDKYFDGQMDEKTLELLGVDLDDE